MASSSCSAGVEREQQQQQPPLRDHEGAAAAIAVLPPKLWLHPATANYPTWRDQMIDFIRSKGWLGYIDGTNIPPPAKIVFDPMLTAMENPDYDSWKGYDRVVKELILVFLPDDLVPRFAALDTARDVWLSLENEFSNSQPQSWTTTNCVEEGLVEPAIWKNLNVLERAAVQCNWETAKRILDALPVIDQQIKGILYRIALNSITGGKRMIEFLTKLVAYLPDELLFMTDSNDQNALHHAAYAGNKAVAIVLVQRVPDLVYAADSHGNLPVYIAAKFYHEEMLQYLMSVTKWDVSKNPFAADARGQLQLFIELTYHADFFDIALDLVDKYPQIATTKNFDNITALHHVAEVASESSFDLWCNIFLGPLLVYTSAHKRMQQILELVKCLCKPLESLSRAEASEIYTDAILTAARWGSHEVVEAIAEAFPSAITCTEPNTNYTIFHLAIKHRNEQVFNLIHRVGCYRHAISEVQDSEGNNMLHLVAKLPDFEIFFSSWKAFHIQYELQWYQEVSKVVTHASIFACNKDDKTPWMLFVEEHKKLKEDGEKWMKDLANSCSIVAALIVTTMFAAAITEPGGNESNTGLPLLMRKKAFIVFALADATSLFTSVIWLSIFLFISTKNFTFGLFQFYEPTLLIVGLMMLSVSLITMMVAFIAAIFLLLGRKEAWILIPTSILSCLAVVCFMIFQVPMVLGMSFVTYSRGFFARKSKKPLL